MNRGDIRQAIRDDIDEATAAYWSDAILNRYIDRAHVWARNVLAQLDEDFLERRVDGTYPGNQRAVLFRDLGLPDEPLAMVGVWDITDNADQGVQLDHVSLHQGEQLYRTGAASTAVGGPAYFISANEGGAREFCYRPLPGTARQLRMVFVREAPSLTTDRDVPDLPAVFHEAIVLRGVILAKKREQAPVKDYEDELSRIVQTAVLTLDGRHADVDTRMEVSDVDFYSYS